MTCSTVKVSREDILSACEKFASWRKNKITEHQEPFIQQEMKRTWFQKLFRRPAKTREEAVDYLNRLGPLWSDFTTCNIWYYEEQGMIRELQAMLSLSESDSLIIGPPYCVFVNEWK